MNTLLRREVEDLPAYTLHHHPCRVKLNQNENPYDVPAGLKEKILAAFGAMSWSRYPEFVPQRQIDLVARFAGWHPYGTLLGNGSNDLLQLLFTCALERGRTVVLSQPTFTLYKLLAKSLGASVREVPMSDGFRFDVEGIIRAARESDAAMVVLCSPNNPTGTTLSREEVARVVGETTGLVVLDEAYVHFAGETNVPLLETRERLVILQTFSKALGAASLRMGYSLASRELTGRLAAVKLPYSVNTFTLTAVEMLIGSWEEVSPWIGAIVRERERVRTALSVHRSLRVHPSRANFLLVETMERTPKEIFDFLLQKGILIRDVSSYPGLSRGLRVTIGTPGENDEFLTALKEVL
jgi:histidinol-phosphate aminotransferase